MKTFNDPKTMTEIMEPQAFTETRTCAECGKPFELPPFKIAAQFVKICPICSDVAAEMDMQAAREKARAQNRLAASWKKSCPEIFQETERRLLPMPAKLDTVLAWTFGSRGLTLHGPTSRGKSRCAWELVKREYFAGRTWNALDSKFAFEYAEVFKRPHEASRWMEPYFTVDLLLMDDVFKSRLTDSVEQALFAIINERTERGKPLIVTTNDSGATLENRMSADRGPALVRRLREFCENVSFD